MRQLANGFRKRYGDLLKYDVEEELARFKEYRQKLGEYVVDAVQFMSSAQKSNKKILIEGANGEHRCRVEHSSNVFVGAKLTKAYVALMLDLDWGRSFHRLDS